MTKTKLEILNLLRSAILVELAHEDDGRIQITLLPDSVVNESKTDIKKLLPNQIISFNCSPRADYELMNSLGRAIEMSRVRYEQENVSHLILFEIGN